jgi:hypothetical protein
VQLFGLVAFCWLFRLILQRYSYPAALLPIEREMTTTNHFPVVPYVIVTSVHCFFGPHCWLYRAYQTCAKTSSSRHCTEFDRGKNRIVSLISYWEQGKGDMDAMLPCILLPPQGQLALTLITSHWAGVISSRFHVKAMLMNTIKPWRILACRYLCHFHNRTIPG